MTIKPELEPQVIFRVPKFAMNAKLADCWDDLKASIALSSPEFHKIIADTSFAGISALPEKVQHTIDKYFNRARFRPVPYGTFAGIGIIDPAAGDTVDEIEIASAPILHSYVDWPAKDNFPYDFEEVLASDALVVANSSYYRAGDKLRYLYREESKFELAEIDPTPQITDVLYRCTRPVAISRLLAELNMASGSSPVPELIEGMIGAQLLLTSLDVNVIGEDYFRRRGISTEGQPTYDIQEQPYLGGRLPQSLLRNIPSVIEKLYRLMPVMTRTPDLREFIRRFERRFDRQAVPLMVALDPELGVGYGNFEMSGGTESLVAHLARGRFRGAAAAEEELLEAIGPEVFTGHPGPVTLDKLLQSVKKEDKPPLPNTFSVLVTCCDGVANLEYAGSPSATMLAGRFTLAGEGIATFARELAVLEQEANPEVLLFDIAYLAEVKADNVNRRKRIYEAQLSILNYDTSACPLTLDDIYISLQGGDVVLWSRSLRKRLIPRTASAYNHSRSDLPLFRLLSDLQQQGLHTHLNLDLQALRPGLDYYPRVQDRNVVLSAAKWRLDLAAIFTGSTPRTAAALREHLKGRGATGYLKHGPADQKLCFNLDSDADLDMMLRHWEGDDLVYVEEAFIPTGSVIKAENGEPYYGQFLLSLAHKEQIYPAADIRLPERPAAPSFFAPGSPWLYWEIFCHPSRADQLLLGEVSMLLDQNRERVKKWFFIRYDEGGPHIRLRMLVEDPADAPALIIELQQLLSPRLADSLVSDLQLKTYRRELERYGSVCIELTETHFCMDSRYVRGLLERQFSDFEKYWLCVDLARSICNAGVVTLAAVLEVARKSYRNLALEHQAKTPETKLLNLNYLDFRKTPVPVLDDVQQELRLEMLHTLTLLLLGKTDRERTRLFGDLMHMHINRLFADHQRSHELIFYNFLIKEWQREMALGSDPEIVNPVQADVQR